MGVMSICTKGLCTQPNWGEKESIVNKETTFKRQVYASCKEGTSDKINTQLVLEVGKLIHSN
jgi:hypothetical protein